jgi:hypothetical protein
MSAIELLHSTLSSALPHIHSKRLSSLCAAVQAACSGAAICITEMGRFLASNAHTKHNIKRMDRLIGNAHLGCERHEIYCTMTRMLLRNIEAPIILIDWSVLCADQQFHVLRASIPVGGRALTLYEKIYPQTDLGNRDVQHAFLNTLAAFLGAEKTPIIVADSGFRVPFYRKVEALGWHWVGRIRNRDFVRFNAENPWITAKSLYGTASSTAQLLGDIDWTSSNTLTARLVLIKTPKQQREKKTKTHKNSKASYSKKQAKREAEPWLLVYSRSLSASTAKRIVNLYKTRMQIEENFRDTKNNSYGLGVCKLSRVSIARRSILLLIAALAQWLLWLTGNLLRGSDIEKKFRVNSKSKRESYSCIFLARQLFKHRVVMFSFLTPCKFLASLASIKAYTEGVLVNEI